MSMEFRIEGLDKLIKRIRTTDASRKMAGVLNLEAELIMTDSKKNYVPWDDGILAGSGHVKKPIIRRHTAKVIMGYGGAASRYALALHEFPSKHSPPSWKDKTSLNWTRARSGPKYLSRPFKKAKKGMGRRIQKNLDLF